MRVVTARKEGLCVLIRSGTLAMIQGTEKQHQRIGKRYQTSETSTERYLGGTGQPNICIREIHVHQGAGKAGDHDNQLMIKG